MIKSESIEVEQKHLLIQRILSSDLFQKSPRLRDFLLYTADCTLDHRLDDVREQVIAERVFGRRPEFQGAQDSIVRAEARNLRRRLDTYFATEGKDEPLVAVMPKGGYALVFETRSIELEAETLSPTPINAVVAPQVTPAEPTTLRVSQTTLYRNLCFALACVTALALAFALHWHSADAALRKQLAIVKPVLPFSALFSAGQDSLIVTSDTGLLQISSLAHRHISLDDYMARSYPDVPNVQPPSLIRDWNIWDFTDGREMAIAGLIIRGNAQYAQHIALRSGHEVKLQDFKDKSIVLIGSPISNPWAQLYEDKLNFRSDLEPDGRIVFRNKLPAPGESSRFPSDDDVRHNRTYARLVLLPKNSNASSTLLIAGTTAQSTAIAGEFVADKLRFDPTLRSIGVDPDGPPRFFEILIRCNNFVDGAILPEVVASKVKPAPDR